MGIHAGGCIYVGKDGKRRDIDLSAASRLPEGFKSIMDMLSPGARGRLAKAGADTGAGDPRAMLSGMMRGNTLRGRGREEARTLEEMDPEAATVRVGPPVGCNEKDADGDLRVAPDGTGWRIPRLTRTFLEKDEHSGLVTLYEYQAEERKTPGGRTVGVTGEERRVVGSWMPGDGGDPSPYEVRDFGDGQCPMWAIHLPSNILMVAGKYVDVAEGLQAYDAGDGNDWFVCPVTDGHVFMKVSSWFYESACEEANDGSLDGLHFDRKGSVNASVEFVDTPDDEDGSPTGMFSEWIEICNIVDGVPYQKVKGAIVLHGPPCEPLKNPLVGEDEVDLLNIYRIPDGCVALSAPVKIVGDGGITVTHGDGGMEGSHVFTISGQGGGEHDLANLEAEVKSGIQLEDIKDEEDEDVTIGRKIDLIGRAQIDDALEIRLRPVRYVDADGAQQTCYVFASEDLSPIVTTVNKIIGEVNVIGGKDIEVSTEGRTITISYKEGKDADDDPGSGGNECGHPGSLSVGGVLAGGGGGESVPTAGGVPAGDGAGTHPGNPCNCE